MRCGTDRQRGYLFVPSNFTIVYTQINLICRFRCEMRRVKREYLMSDSAIHIFYQSQKGLRFHDNSQMIGKVMVVVRSCHLMSVLHECEFECSCSLWPITQLLAKGVLRTQHGHIYIQQHSAFNLLCIYL